MSQTHRYTITKEQASEMGNAVRQFLGENFPQYSTFDAMEAICDDWEGDSVFRIDCEDEDTLLTPSPELERLKKVHDRIKNYSDVTGISVSEVVAKALEEWMDVTGDLHLENLSGAAASDRESGKVLPWPEPSEKEREVN